jgi:hypothetical protein
VIFLISVDERSDVLMPTATSNAERDSAAHAEGEEAADIADDAEADGESRLTKTLVLVDFNGMLCFKDKTNRLNSNLPFFVGGTNKGMARFFLRPGAMEFVARLSNDKRCVFALYTSMKKHNIVPFLQKFDELQEIESKKRFVPFIIDDCDSRSVSSISSLQKSMFRLFDQPYNSPDPQPSDPYGFKRDLSKVLKDPKVQEAGFSMDNTLLIEGEALKARDCAANHLQPKEFTMRDVVAADGGGPDVLDGPGATLDQIFAKMQAPGATIPKVLQAL